MIASLVDRDTFRSAMRRLPGGCCIVSLPTSTGPAGRLISAVTSLTAEPPSILISLMRSAAITDEIMKAGRCSLAILSVANLESAAAFSQSPPIPMAARFAAGRWRQNAERLWLEGAAANLFCSVEDVFEVETHAVFAARVLAAECEQEAPLVYVQAQFGRHSPCPIP